MTESCGIYQVFLDERAVPPMYGIRVVDGQCARRISTDFCEVNRLAQCCTAAGLSPLHLRDVVEDFRRG